ncbi:MAG: MerR family transcriptional regulator [Chloroflexota bacterium]|nr:MerR family transcriptional regulator [Chloroflexota bacterium]
MKVGLTIGELAGELQLNPKTIRYYEEVGLLSKPRRSESGYRLYSRDDIERLRLVKRAKLLGLSLAEIKELVEYAIDGRCSTLKGHLLSLVGAKLEEIDQKMQELVVFRGELRRCQSELSRRFNSEAQQEGEIPPSASCRCIGEEVDGFLQETKNLSRIQPSLVPGQATLEERRCGGGRQR